MGSTNLWDAEWDLPLEMASALIYSQFPQLSSKRIRRLDHGWDNTVYLVGNEYVFRFPRRQVAVSLLEMEGRILPKLADRISIPYSKPVFHGVGNQEYPSPFLGYTYLPGKFPIGLTDEHRCLSISALARFLKGLHAFPVQDAEENGAPHDHRNLTDIASRKEKMLTFLSDLRGHIREEDYRQIEAYLQSLTIDRVEPKEVFLHGDLHFKNMLVDESGQIAGIIDWGDMNIGHPACDLSVAYNFVPPGGREAFFKEYGEVDEETHILARLIAVYIPMLILLQAVTDHNAEIAEEAKANIRRALVDE
ncbi:aminoglycoside phosphotransferase family protein [Paenibacillus sp. KQZ6P-2]|uniref:Aminoglycoside phosphotransferase family protein n=1 Tax=Paenibacillus mangrovi TaxID=2931978 RepID=A0A9X1WL87_9BACL|nr:aminoglycoside phosphotransferase family protein [Paenibacillus mangrovi]MCJ8011018.1 aminoglycoside phosphotransferase family protein [Paenibacillus mangrovi]